jgi:hypothetical protein
MKKGKKAVAQDAAQEAVAQDAAHEALVQDAAHEALVQDAARIDFSRPDALDRISEFEPRKRLHMMRHYLKFKKIFATRYEVECLMPDIPNLIVRYYYNGMYNFVLAYRTPESGLSKAMVVLDTRELPEQLAEVVFHATLALITYIDGGLSLDVLRDLRKSGYVIRQTNKAGSSGPNSPDFREYFKYFLQ